MLDKEISEVLRQMSPPIALLADHGTITEAIEKMTNHGVGYCLVGKDGRADGILTERDILTRVVTRGLSADEVTAASIASRPLVTVRLNTPVYVALDLMAENHFRCLPVQEGEVLRGALTMMSLISWIADEMSADASDLSRYIAGPAVALRLPAHARVRRFSSPPSEMPLASRKV